MFDVTFTPQLSQRSQGQLRLTVMNNQYEDTLIEIVGEGYEDDISLSNVHSVAMTTIGLEQEEGNMADDDVAGKQSLVYSTSVAYRVYYHIFVCAIMYDKCVHFSC